MKEMKRWQTLKCADQIRRKSSWGNTSQTSANSASASLTPSKQLWDHLWDLPTASTQPDTREGRAGAQESWEWWHPFPLCKHEVRGKWWYHSVACRSWRDAEPCPCLPVLSSSGTPALMIRKHHHSSWPNLMAFNSGAGCKTCIAPGHSKQPSPKTAPKGGKHQPACVLGRCSTPASSDKRFQAETSQAGLQDY